MPAILSSISDKLAFISFLSFINEENAKYVISATPLLQDSDYNGVTHLSLRKFLTEGFGND